MVPIVQEYKGGWFTGNEFDKICVVHSLMGYIFVARYQAIQDDSFAHYYQITFERSGVYYAIGQYPMARQCRDVTREEFFDYLEAAWPDDLEWFLFHPELYSVEYSPDV